ncbi:MAG: hypothetical protein ACLQVG_00110 [Terriglobia bacterium]
MQTQTANNLGHKVREGKKWHTMAAAELKGVARAAEVDAVYAEFMKTPEGTREYFHALEVFISLLFPECNSQNRTRRNEFRQRHGHAEPEENRERFRRRRTG